MHLDLISSLWVKVFDFFDPVDSNNYKTEVVYKLYQPKYSSIKDGSPCENGYCCKTNSVWSDIVDATYIINLERRGDRKSNMMKLAEANEISGCFMHPQINPEKQGMESDEFTEDNRRKMEPVFGYPSNWESHRATCSDAVNKGYKRILVLEDDVEFLLPYQKVIEKLRYFFKVIEETNRLWARVQLGGCTLISWPAGGKLFPGFGKGATTLLHANIWNVEEYCQHIQHIGWADRFKIVVNQKFKPGAILSLAHAAALTVRRILSNFVILDRDQIGRPTGIDETLSIQLAKGTYYMIPQALMQGDLVSDEPSESAKFLMELGSRKLFRYLHYISPIAGWLVSALMVYFTIFVFRAITPIFGKKLFRRVLY